MIDWPKFTDLVNNNERFVLTSHVRPDCDALGSELAMLAILGSLGKEVLVVNASAVPPNMQFLDPDRRLKQLGADIEAKEIESYDVLIILDTTAWAQLGDMAEVVRTTALKKAVIDHHVSGDDLGAELFKNGEAEATGRLVVEAADALGVELTPEIAKAVFSALATDTGWFRFSSTTPETLRLASRLMEAGAAPDEFYCQRYEQDTLARLQLVGRTKTYAKTELDGRLIYTHITQADFKETGAVPSDSEDVINMMLAVGGTEAAVIFVELSSGGFKISFRSRCDLDCSRLAEQFGGGGHKKAAGAFINEPLDVTQDKVLAVIRAAMGSASDSNGNPGGSSRRQCLGNMAAITLGAAGLACPAVVSAAAALNPLCLNCEEGRFIKVALLNAVPEDGTPRRFPVVADRDDAWNHFPDEPIGAVFLRRSGADGIEAIQVICPHAGCHVNYEPQKDIFFCPCHRASFSPSGKRLDEESPSPRDLDTLEVELRDGTEVWVKFEKFQAGITQKIVKS
jgi:phosphoesterase RecJ-like protein